MKQTEICYVKLSDGCILITDIRNAEGQGDIREEFGMAVEKLYTSGIPRYLGDAESPPAQISITTEAYFHGNAQMYLTVGMSYTKERFAQAIAAMKEAGERLRRICNDDREGKLIKTVKI